MDGQPVFVGQARYGSTHDLTATRAHEIIDATTKTDVEGPAYSGYQDATGAVHAPVKHPRHPGHNAHEKQTNQLHAASHAPGEHGLAPLENRRAPRPVPTSPCRASDPFKATHRGLTA